MPKRNPDKCYDDAGLLARRNTPAPYDGPEQRILVENEYIVTLVNNYTVDEHFKFTGMNLSTIGSKFKKLAGVEIYMAHFDAHVVHNIIRYDPGVLSVAPNYFLNPLETLPEPDPDSYPRLNRRWARTYSKRGYFARMLGTWGRLSTPVRDFDTWIRTLKNAGKGTYVYVMDSGVRLTHFTFQKPNGPAVNFKAKLVSPYCYGFETMEDEMGHGTKVASVVKAHAYGATIVNVKVLCNSGNTVLGMLDAIYDIIAEHKLYIQNPPEGWRGSVINMSFRLDTNPQLKRAIADAIAAGIPVTTSAGNGDSRNIGQPVATAPCGWDKVQCVAACDNSYKRTSFTNFGRDITYVAPGKDIWGASHQADDVDYKADGTSFASPSLAGIMAIYISYEAIQTDVSKVIQRLQDNAQDGLLGSDWAPNTIDRMPNSGMENPKKNYWAPYVNAPGRALMYENEANVPKDPPTPPDVELPGLGLQTDDSPSQFEGDEIFAPNPGPINTV